ncbi:MAG: AmmeMemoRadiSam system protein B [Gemmatimonadota bacterium]|nr:MAG: AmmeMemoRadiSam system protein B [Gemmatimonadota bacterium]
MAVRRSTGAGTWFPADAAVLSEAVDGYLSASAPTISGPPIALIVPHAGYVYSGAVAGKTYASLKGHSYERVIVLGVSHQQLVRGASTLEVDAYETPLGRIPVDTAARDALLRDALVSEQQGAHRNEHTIENQLPMLQRALGEFRMVGLLVGELTERERARLAAAIRELMDEETLLVVSTDFCHYGPRFGYMPFDEQVSQNLRALNDLAAQEILEVDVPGWDRFLEDTRATICGRNAVGLLLAILEPHDDIEGRRVAYDTSGRMTGDWSNSVTYAGIVFWRSGGELSQSERQTLLRLARTTVTSFLEEGTVPSVALDEYDLTPRLMAPGAAFVTLRNGVELRGCIGHIAAVRPLYLSVAENAYRASQDPRFRYDPITPDEVAELSIEVSLLTPMRRLRDPNKVRAGVDGLLIVRDQNQGVLLPQVATEQQWNREQFLDNACLKAGLPADAWKDPRTEIYRFTALIFAEEDRGEDGGGESRTR